jgi:hypothetical protein
MRVGRSGVPSWKGRAILLFSKSFRQALWSIHSSIQSVPLFFPGGEAAGTWSQPLISSSPSDHSGNVIMFWCRTKRGCVTAHLVTWHRLYQGVLYFQNVTRFHCKRVHVLYFVHNKSTALPALVFSKLNKCSTALCADLLYRISSKSVSKCFNVRPSLSSQLLFAIMCRPLVPNFIKIGQ